MHESGGSCVSYYPPLPRRSLVFMRVPSVTAAVGARRVCACLFLYPRPVPCPVAQASHVAPYLPQAYHCLFEVQVEDVNVRGVRGQG